MDPITLSIKEAAEVLSLGRTSIYKLIKEGHLEIIKIGRRTLVKVASVHRFVNAEDDR